MAERAHDVSLLQAQQVVLHHLDDATKEKQFDQTRLGAASLGVPRGVVEKAVTLSDVRAELDIHSAPKGYGLVFLYALLKVIGVAARELDELKEYVTDQNVELCEQQDEFKFAKMVILLCNDMTEDDYKKFFNLCRGHFERTIQLEKYPTVEKFFLKLVEVKKVVWPRNVKDLEKILEELGKVESLKHVEEYKRTIGLVQQTSPDQDPPLGSPLSHSLELHFDTAVSESGHHREAELVCANESVQRSSEGAGMNRGNPGSSQVDIPVQRSPDLTVPFRTINGAGMSRGNPDPSQVDIPEQRSPDPAAPLLITNEGSCDLPMDVEPDNPRPPSQRDSALGVSVRSSTALTNSYHRNTNTSPVRGNRDTGGTGDTGESEGNRSRYGSTDGPPVRSFRETDGFDDWVLINYTGKREKPLLKIFCLKFKKPLTCLALTVLPLLVVVGVVVAGGILWSSQVVVQRDKYVVMDDTVILGTVDASVVSAVTVREVTQYGDSSHLSSVYIEPEGGLNKHMDPISAQRPTVYLKTASNFTSLINEVYFGIYLLEKSNISYSFNIASQHSRGTGYFYIFDDKDHFSNFTSKIAGAERYAVHHRQFNIGEFNVTEPTSIQFEAEEASYYFFVAELPGDIYFNFSYKIEQVSVNHLDYEPTCENVYEPANPCPIDLHETSGGKFYILAYVKPQGDDESPTTHLQLVVSLSLTIGKALTFLGVGLLVCCLVACVVWTAVTVKRKGQQNHRYSRV